jgi:hypothetical protein
MRVRQSFLRPAFSYVVCNVCTLSLPAPTGDHAKAHAIAIANGWEHLVMGQRDIHLCPACRLLTDAERAQRRQTQEAAHVARIAVSS